MDELLRRTLERLRAAGIHDEALGAVGKTLLARQPKLLPVGRAWRLGVLLLDDSGHLYETGEVTRAIEPLRAVTNRSAEAEARRDDRRAAARGPFPEGEVVNFGYTPAVVGEGRLSERGGVVFVRWGVGPDVRPLEQYLADRVALAIENQPG